MGNMTKNKKKKKRPKAGKAAKKPAKKGAPEKKSRPAELSEGVHKTKVRVIGIGGGGSNIVAEIARAVGRVDFIAANTDLQAQKNLPRDIKVFAFGQELTKGLGCGMDVQLGEAAAKAEKDRIKKLVEGQDVCILVASLGGGTGSGAASVFAEAAREAKCLTLGIFTMPFSFEGQKRKELAEAALEKTASLLNVYSVIPNENIFRVIDQKTPLRASFSAVNKRLAETLEGFIDTLALPGLINIDFADLRTLLEGRGRLAYLNSAQTQGALGVPMALKELLNNPLYDYGVAGADRVMFNVTGDKRMKMQDVAEISKSIFSSNGKARIIFGISFQPEYRDKLRIALFAMGCRVKEWKKEGDSKTENPKTRAFVPRARKQKARGRKKQAVVKRFEKPKAEKGKIEKAAPPQEEPHRETAKTRRNALEVKKARDLELKDLEKQERRWDIPAFLRNTRREEPAS